MQRDRAKTEQRLIEAVGQIISTEGYDRIGINRIANRAGVNKILIYRYFGGLDGLLAAYTQQVSPAPAPIKLDIERLRHEPLEKVFDLCSEYLIAEYRQLRNNPQAQELLRAELLGKDVPSNPFSIENHPPFMTLIDQIGELIQTRYGPAYVAFVHSAMVMLILLSQQKKAPVGLKLTNEDDWDQIETVIRQIFKGAYLQLKGSRARSGKAKVALFDLATADGQSSDGLSKK
jgi:AcrR family transcriptional regulator